MATKERKKYEEIDAINWSALKHILRSPAHFLAEKMKPKVDTPAFLFGRCAHAAILESKKDYIVAPALDKRTKEYKEWRSKISDGIDILTEAEDTSILRMSEELQSHKHAWSLVYGSCVEKEKTVEWAIGDCKCKARVDIAFTAKHEDHDSYVVEYKTCQDARSHEFGIAAKKFLYHAQLAWYADGLEAMTGKTYKAYIIAQEKEEPYAVALYALTDDQIQLGRAIYETAIDMYRKCVIDNKWPPYEEVVQVLEFPKW